MKLEKLLAGVLRVPPSEIAGDASQDNLPRWNSIKHVELIVMLQKTYGVAFTISEIISMTSLTSIRDQLRRKGIKI